MKQTITITLRFEEGVEPLVYNADGNFHTDHLTWLLTEVLETVPGSLDSGKEYVIPNEVQQGDDGEFCCIPLDADPAIWKTLKNLLTFTVDHDEKTTN
jgi:hypothetical protein